jgi:hypothetical protein
LPAFAEVESQGPMYSHGLGTPFLAALRHAADQWIWAYLGIVEVPDYFHWQWKGPDDRQSPMAIDRFVGDGATNAPSRLWWTAELTRDVAVYGPTVKALSGSWPKPGVLHHRAAAEAVVEFLAVAEDEATAGDRGWMMARSLDIALRTLSLDSLAPAPAPDAEAVRGWCAEPVDETLMIRRLPTGPDEPPVPEQDIAAVRAILDQLAGQAGPRRARARRRAAASASSA